MAMHEAKDEHRRPGLWAKAISEALGDESKATALYIAYRAKQLIADREMQSKSLTESQRQERVLFYCPNCHARLHFTKGQIADIENTINPPWLRICPSCTKTFDMRVVVPGIRNISTASAVKQTSRADNAPSTNASKAKNAVLFSAIGCFIPLLAIVGVVIGHQTLAYAKKHPNENAGENNAITAIAVGYIGIAIQFAVFLGASFSK